MNGIYRGCKDGAKASNGVAPQENPIQNGAGANPAALNF